jgi:hypothetical protein
LAGFDAQNQRAAAQITNQRDIASMNEQGRNQRTAAQLENSNRQLAARISAQSEGGVLTPAARRQLLTRGQAMVNGVSVTRNGVKGTVTYSYNELVRFFVAAGVPAAEARRMAVASGAKRPNPLGSASGSAYVGPDRPPTGGTGGGGF